MRYKFYALALIMAAVIFAGPYGSGEASAGSGNNFGGIFSPDGKYVDLYETLGFDAFKASGDLEDRQIVEKKLSEAEPAAFFLEGIRKINERTTLLVISVMYCPDAAAVYPYLEAMAAANPFVSVRYLVRDSSPEAKEFLFTHTGRTDTPSIFVIRRGKVISGAYVETPARVTALLEGAKSEEERGIIWRDLHSGVYDEDIQRDLLDLLAKQ